MGVVLGLGVGVGVGVGVVQMQLEEVLQMGLRQKPW